MFLSWHGFSPKKKIHLKPPRIKATKEISIVIPVKNNQKGIDLRARASTGTVAITVTSYNNFEGEVYLNLWWPQGEDGELPSGVTAEFDPANITLTTGGEASSTVTIAVSSTATKDTYFLDIQVGWQVDVTGVEYQYKAIWLQVS